MDLVRFLCELDEEGKCQDRRNYRDEHGNTLLHAACERNHAEREVEAFHAAESRVRHLEIRLLLLREKILHTKKCQISDAVVASSAAADA